MGNPIAQQRLDVRDTRNIGAIEYSNYNMEAATKNNPYGMGKWVAMDGMDRERSSCAPYSKAFDAFGIPAATVRTWAATPASYAIAAGGSNIVASAASGTTGMQYSTDNGTTWIQTSLVTPAAFSAYCILYTGIRWIAASSGYNPYVTTADNPGSTWTACTAAANGGGTGQQSLAYSPTLAKVAYIVTGGANTSVYTLADGATAFVTLTGTSCNKNSICWSGSKFIIPTQNNGLIQTCDGTTVTDTYHPQYEPGSAATSSCASDGNGTVVIAICSSATSYFLVSNDHGTTWRKILPPSEAYRGLGGLVGNLTLYNIAYVNNKFMVFDSTNYWLMSSVDGIQWYLDRPALRGIAPLIGQTVVYRAGVYVAGMITATTFSWTEDFSKFRMPGQPCRSSGELTFEQAYTKVRM